MPLIELNLKPTDRELRQFAALVVPLAVLLLVAVLWWRNVYSLASVWVLLVAALFGLAGMIRPALARPIYLGWMYASYPIGWVTGHVVIGAVFFLVLTPIGLLMRGCRRDPLQRKFDASRASYWEKRPPHENDPARYFRQF